MWFHYNIILILLDMPEYIWVLYIEYFIILYYLSTEPNSSNQTSLREINPLWLLYFLINVWKIGVPTEEMTPLLWNAMNVGKSNHSSDDERDTGWRNI